MASSTASATSKKVPPLPTPATLTVHYLMNGKLVCYNVRTHSAFKISTESIGLLEWAQLIEVNQTLHLMGGHTSASKETDVHCHYALPLLPAPDPHKFVKKADIPLAVTGFGATRVLSEWVYLAGGYAPNQSYHNECWKYSVSRDVWARAPSMNVGRAGHGICTISERTIFVYRGNVDRSEDFNMLERLDTADEEQGWVIVQIPKEVGRAYLDPLFVPVSNTEILIMGGGYRPDVPQPTWIYDSLTSKFIGRAEIKSQIICDNMPATSGHYVYCIDFEEKEESGPPRFYITAVSLFDLSIRELAFHP